jgi:Archaeal/vacuolar-type H+-ATPase subunit I
MNPLLRTLQSLQNVELFSVAEKADEQWSTEAGDSDELLRWQSEHDQIGEALAFLDAQALPAKKKKKTSPLPARPTLRDIEAWAKKYPFRDRAQSIRRIRDQLRAGENFAQQREEQTNALRIWKDLPALPSLKQTGMAYLEADSAHREELLEKLTADPDAAGDIALERNGRLYLWLAFPAAEWQRIERRWKEWGCTELRYPYTDPPEQLLAENERERLAFEKKRTEWRDELMTLRDEREPLRVCQEALACALERETKKAQLLSTEHTVLITGWIPAERAEDVAQACEKHLAAPYFLDWEDVQPDEPLDDVPILLKNHRIFTPFESVTEMYSLPMYDEVDPTPYMSIFYWVFFGMMVADLGYGFVLWLASLIALRLPLRRSMRSQMKFFHTLSYSGMIWGLIYGSAFGASLPFQLLSVETDVNTILVLSVVLGYIQILAGLILSVGMLAKKGDRLGLMSGSGSWLGVMASLGIVAVGAMVFRNQTVTVIGGVLAAVFLVLVVVGNALSNQSRAKGIAMGLYEVYGITGYLGDLVSYTRLMALGLAGGSIGAAFNLIVNFMPPIARFSVGIAIIVALHTLNFFLTMLGAYVHSARLQYVEFFGKFYSGGGRAFVPLKAVEANFDVWPEEQQEGSEE